MSLLEHINLYFGTEYESIREFITDFRRGVLADDYANNSEKLSHLLMFMSAYSQVEEVARKDVRTNENQS